MDPYLRPAPVGDDPSAPCPPGHVAEPAGLWDGEHHEVVYDPASHDVLIVRGHIGEVIDHGLSATGWERQTDADNAQLWVRDRAAATRTLLATASTETAMARGISR
jgi:hypothetical protein